MVEKVALVSVKEYGSEIKRAVNQALTLIGGIKKVVRSGDLVLIKPNLVNNRDGESGNVTHFSLIELIIKACSDAGADEIFVGDGSGEVDTHEALSTSGMKRAIDQLSSDGLPVRFVDLNYDKNPETSEFDKISLGKAALNPNYVYRIGHTVLKADVIISVPKLKTHTRVGISVALKNVVGMAPGGYYGFPKWRGRLEVLPHGPTPQSPVILQTILDLNRIALGRYPGSPKQRRYLVVVDGVVAGVYYKTNPEGIPLWKPVKFGSIIAGTDPVAVDTVSARLMCYRPEKIPLIKYAADLGMGTMTDIEIAGNPVEDIRIFVPPPDDFLSIADKRIDGVRKKVYLQAVKKTAKSALRPVSKPYRLLKYRLRSHSLRKLPNED